jgi:hypothetical protein
MKYTNTYKKKGKNATKKIKGGMWPFTSNTSGIKEEKKPPVIKANTLPGFMKKEEMRINTVDKKTITSTCDIEDKDDVLEQYIPNIRDILTTQQKIQLPEKTTITLFPYCSEKIKYGDIAVIGEVSKMFDKVNASEVDIDIIDKLKTTFKIEVDDSKIQKSNNKYTSSYDVDKYINYLQDHDNDKNLFIVSHSGFMQKMLFRLSTIKKFQIDNLDIFQFGLVNDFTRKNKFKIKYILVRKWVNNYEISFIVVINGAEIETITELNQINNYKFSDIEFWVFQIRHCKGCHNTETGLVSKVTRTFSQYSVGYLQYALCLNDTPSEMLEKGNKLYNILKEFSKNKEGKLLENYRFGSSVILRAILTNIMQLYTLLGIEQSPPGLPAPVAPAAVSESAVSESAVSESAVAKSAVAEPAVAEPAVSESAVSESAVAAPAVAAPAAETTIVAEPVSEPFTINPLHEVKTKLNPSNTTSTSSPPSPSSIPPSTSSTPSTPFNTGLSFFKSLVNKNPNTPKKPTGTGGGSRKNKCRKNKKSKKCKK